jgi:RNA polymerase sigma-54 factor
MRFETSQHLKLGQSMKLAPRMIQSMEILQMPLAELEERIEQELESNPTLELNDGDADDPGLRMELEEARREEAAADRPLSMDEGSAGDDFERLDSFAESHPDAADNEFSTSDYQSQERS